MIMVSPILDNCGILSPHCSLNASLIPSFLFCRVVHRIGRTGRAGNTGAALSFVNERNSGVVRELRELLEENGQEVPSWLVQMSSYGGRGGGRGRELPQLSVCCD